jgi:hypothetical protein
MGEGRVLGSAQYASGTSNPIGRLLLASILSVAVVLSYAGTASAVTPAARLSVNSFASPTYFLPSHEAQCLETITERFPICDSYRLTATNTGSVPSEGPTILADTLPPGLIVQSIILLWTAKPNHDYGTEGAPSGGDCNGEIAPAICEFPNGLEPNGTLEMIVNTTVQPEAVSGGLNTFRATGGGGLEAAISQTDVISPLIPPFGPNLTAPIVGLDGALDSEAGGHPYGMTTELNFNNVIRRGPSNQSKHHLISTTITTATQDVKDVVVDLPLGFLGTALAAPQCKFIELAGSCPSDTLVGHILSQPESLASANSGIFNMVPDRGVAAELGFTDNLKTTHPIYVNLVPTPKGYIVRATSPDIAQINLVSAIVTLYGNPAEHDGSASAPVAMFTNPADCTGEPSLMHAYADSWQEPGPLNGDGTPDLSSPRWASSSTEAPPVTGCNRLQFSPESFSFQPDTSTTDSPTGMSFDLRIPQTEEPSTLATPPLKNATVTLPAGVIVNPAAAGGLASCSLAQIGWLGGTLTNFTASPPTCPDASKIGSVALTTPLLAGTLTGSVYLAAQDENPFHSLLAGYIVVDDPTTGVVVKIPGKLMLNEHTGQITGIFNENPQLPFSDLKLHFFGGTARGELATPESCGTFETTGELEPWSAPDSGPNAKVHDTFSINNGCTPGFAPAFSAGSASAQAGAYTPFTMSFSRQDGEQEISGLSLSLPSGLEGKIAGVEECSEAQIAAATSNPSGAAEQAHPSCPAGSQIGTVQTTAGAGTAPFSLSGTAYLTGPYKGAPYGIAVVVPAIAGPLDLGTVVVRSALHVDPNDAHVTVISDPFPTILDRQGDGLPIRLRSVAVTVDRPGFTLNPTNCNPLTINASLTSTLGTTVPVSSAFQASGCRELTFHPTFTVSTQAHSSKASGASLHVKVTSGSGQANIAKVHVTLPKQLPSRLSTIQKACLLAVFNVNPASCAAGSLVGTATASTPLLAKPLTGPAYFVSHGGAAFPDLEIVLQGEGITLILDGNTDIKKGITTSTFNAVPDAPVTNFELNLPEGPNSILATFLPAKAKYDFCGQQLTMPTLITGQNGATVKQTTKIAVTGCPKHPVKKSRKHKKTRRKH